MDEDEDGSRADGEGDVIMTVMGDVPAAEGLAASMEALFLFGEVEHSPNDDIVGRTEVLNAIFVLWRRGEGSEVRAGSRE